MDLLDKMATYVRVIEAGSFSAAAKQLRVSPAAVSRQIATLEAELGVSLVRRSTRRMAITASGRRYYERCLRVLREVDDAQAVGREAGLDGVLHVTAPVTFGIGRVVPHLLALLDKHPALRIDLRLEDHMVDLALEGVDVAIRVGSEPPESTSLVAHRLYVFARVMVAAPEYLKHKREPKTPEALAKHDALTYGAGRAIETWELAGKEREARVQVAARFHCTAPHVIRELAVAGAGVAILPEWLVAGDLRRRTLRQILPEWQSIPVPVYAIHRREQRGAPRVRTLIEHLRAAYTA